MAVLESALGKGGGKMPVKRSSSGKTADSGGNPHGGEGQPAASKKRKAPPSWEEEGKRKRRGGTKGETKSKPAKPGSKGCRGARDRERDLELKEMWNTVAGGGLEGDQESVRAVDDDAFIDDSGLYPVQHFLGVNEARSAGDALQAEEDEEINQLFRGGRKKKKEEKSAADLALVVEHVMAELEVTAEEDAELNRQSKPAINKLRKLPLLIEVLSKKNFQREFLDHGVLTLLKNWLEPLPDGSLPNVNIRTAILEILTDFPIDLEECDRRDQLKKSGLGKVIMFLSKSDEETTANRRLSKSLVEKWSRPIFNKSIRFEDLRAFDEETTPYHWLPMNKLVAKTARLEARGDDLDESSKVPKSGKAPWREHVSRPEPLPLVFVVRPPSKVDPEEIRTRTKQVSQDQHRLKVDKKLQLLKAQNRRQLQAAKLSVEGRGMVRYL